MKNEKQFSILVFNENGNEISYWFGANSQTPNDSIFE